MPVKIIPDRSVRHRSHDQDKRNQPERTPINTKRDVGNSNSSNSIPIATVEKTRESGRLNEGSRSNFVGRFIQLNDRVTRDDLDEIAGQGSAGSYRNSRTQSAGVLSPPTSKANGKRLHTVPEENIINLKTNCFEVGLDGSVQLYRYHVHVTPKPRTPREHHRAFELFLKEGSCLDDSRHAGATKVLGTDHRNTVVTIRPLKLGSSDRGQCLVDYYEPEYTRPKKIPSTNTYVFTISLTKTQPMSLSEVMDHVASTSAQASFGRIESTIQVLNIAMSKKPWENVLGPLDGGLVAQGYHSARIINAGPSLFANIIPRIGSFYKSGPLVDLIRAFRSSGKTLLQLHGFLKGVRVEYRHLKSESGRYRVKTITGLANVPKLGANANEATFVWMKKDISVAGYYKQRHRKTLGLPSEPVVDVGTTKNPTLLPPELCYVLPDQRANQALSSDQAKKMNKLQLQNASNLVNPIEDRVGHKGEALAINARDISEPESFGVSTQANVLRLTGRVLPAPQIQYQGMKFKPDFGSWNLKEDRKFKTGAGITSWAYTEIQFPNQGRPTSLVKQFINTLEKSYQSTICARQNRLSDLVLNCTCSEKQFAVLDKYFHHCWEESVKMLLLFSPVNGQTLFACIKYLADVKYGIHTICLEISTLQKYINKPWYAATIAQKLNTKGGGVNQCLPPNELRSLLPTSTMVVGIDVTNPFPKGQALAATSIIGVVASKNGDCTQWPASVRRQDRPDKIVVDLKEMMTERLDCWKATNGSLPSNILIYRNNVTEKATAVALNELKAIEQAIAHIFNGRTLPKITAMTISRSHRLRFYPDDDRAADGQSGNPKVGTVVDRVVTSNVSRNFYLQSHPGTTESGTVCPAHYVVVKNDMEFSTDVVQLLTNKLCYLSARSTRAMSIVPPARYAAAVCARARCFVMACAIAGGEGGDGNGRERERWVAGVSEELRDSMWYV
ncbi:ribonuclease H-like domain-containing protein [Usnea florida]